MGDNIESHNQSGGTTAHTVCYAPNTNKTTMSRGRKMLVCLGAVASIATISSWIGIDFSKKEEPMSSVDKSVHVTSYNQSGGITAHTVNVNEAPAPELKTVDETATVNEAGAYNFKRTIEMNAPYAGSLVVTIKAEGLMNADIGEGSRKIQLPGNTMTIGMRPYDWRMSVVV